MGNWTFFCIVSLVTALLTKGSTLGHLLSRMTLVSDDGGVASKWQIVKRYLFIWLFTQVPHLIIYRLTDGSIIDIEAHGTLVTILMLLRRAYFYWYFINAVFLKGAPMPHDKLSKTRYILIKRGHPDSH